MKAFD